MFLGHLAAGLIATRAEPRLRPGTAMIAAQLPDVVWPYLLQAGVERVRIDPDNTVVTPLAFDHSPWSHSLLMTVAWGVAMALLWRRQGRRAGVLLVLLSVSHWVLDVVSHRPDMPLAPGLATKLGSATLQAAERFRYSRSAMSSSSACG